MEVMLQALQEAVEDDERTLYRLAKESGLHYSILDRLMNGERTNVTISTVAALADVLGMELRPRKGR